MFQFTAMAFNGVDLESGLCADVHVRQPWQSMSSWSSLEFSRGIIMLSVSEICSDRSRKNRTTMILRPHSFGHIVYRKKGTDSPRAHVDRLAGILFGQLVSVC